MARRLGAMWGPLPNTQERHGAGPPAKKPQLDASGSNSAAGAPAASFKSPLSKVSSPYVQLQPTAIVLSGSSASSRVQHVVISGSTITLQNGIYQVSISGSQIQLAAGAGAPTATLTNSALTFANGNASVVVNPLRLCCRALRVRHPGSR